MTIFCDFSVILRTYSHRAKANVKAKKIKEKISNIKVIFRFRFLFRSVNGLLNLLSSASDENNKNFSTFVSNMARQLSNYDTPSYQKIGIVIPKYNHLLMLPILHQNIRKIEEMLLNVTLSHIHVDVVGYWS